VSVPAAILAVSEPTGYRIYPPGERPEVEVRLDEDWLPAEIRSWSPRPVRLVGQLQLAPDR